MESYKSTESLRSSNRLSFKQGKISCDGYARQERKINRRFDAILK